MCAGKDESRAVGAGPELGPNRGPPKGPECPSLANTLHTPKPQGRGIVRARRTLTPRTGFYPKGCFMRSRIRSSTLRASIRMASVRSTRSFIVGSWRNAALT